MELVDIDKVLDSLELKEEELENIRNAIIPDISTQPSSYISPIVVVQSSEATNQSSGEAAAAADRVKKFVGVSQVLCSLNEYRKNITRLDLYKKNYDFTDMVLRRGVINDDDDDQVHDDDDVEEEEEEEEDVIDDDDACESTEENGLSSNSLTTSSSSSFLSGSSPALLSTEEEAAAANNDKTSGGGSGESNNKQLEDLALGLASISIEAAATNNEEEEEEEGQTTAASSDNKDQEAAGGNSRQMPVTLDSTMDEISDTELDRMLNEIDTETEIETEANVLEEEEEEEEETVESRKPTADIKSTTSPAVSCTPKSPPDADALINFDTFSQASTLEFMEDRTDAAGLDLDQDDDVERLVDVYKKKPRPTSLDLPARRVNLYSTAGQTPPAAAAARVVAHDGNATNSESDQEEEEEEAAGSSTADKSLEDAAVDDTSHSSDVTEMENKTSLIEAEEEEETRTPPPPPPAVGQEDPSDDISSIGKLPPIWVPDQETSVCMQCEQKFTLLKRRHHCRACGQVLCSICCSQKFKLQFLSSNIESRVCVQCFIILSKPPEPPEQQQQRRITDVPPPSKPNPNNPMEYCSKIPPHRQVNQQSMASCPPTVIVPVGVLKKETTSSSSSSSSRKRKSVMFSDGIRPGSDLATFNHKWSDAKHARRSMKVYLNLKTQAECDDWESRKGQQQQQLLNHGTR